MSILSAGTLSIGKIKLGNEIKQRDEKSQSCGDTIELEIEKKKRTPELQLSVGIKFVSRIREASSFAARAHCLLLIVSCSSSK